MVCLVSLAQVPASEGVIDDGVTAMAPFNAPFRGMFASFCPHRRRASSQRDCIVNLLLRSQLRILCFASAGGESSV